MTGLEKIIFDIEDEAKAAADTILQTAKNEAEAIIEQAKADSAEKSSAIAQQSEIAVKDYLTRANSAAELQKRKSILNAKQQIINEVIDKAQQSLYALSEEEYFSTIIRMIEKFALPQKGEIIFSAQDLKRFPKGFEAKIKEAAGTKAELTISEETRDISGGFVLVYGGVEENCSFSALFDSVQETLQDKVHEILF